MTVALASNSLKSVSSTGLDSQNLRPLSLFRMLTMLSISLWSTIRFVLQRICAFTPSTPFIVTWILFLSQGASRYTSSMCGSDRRTSKIPAPTECL